MQNPHTSAGTRPVFLDLRRISLPVGALTSIAHRASGVLLAMVVPFAIYGLSLSLQSEQGFALVVSAWQHPVLKLLGMTLVWGLTHHVLAGVRHLLMDLNLGSPLRTARRSAWAVNVGAVVIALGWGTALWLR